MPPEDPAYYSLAVSDLCFRKRWSGYLLPCLCEDVANHAGGLFACQAGGWHQMDFNESCQGIPQKTSTWQCIPFAPVSAYKA